MTSSFAKPELFMVDEPNSHSHIPYEEGFEYEPFEADIFKAEGNMVGKTVFIEWGDCVISFSLDALLATALADIDDPDGSGDSIGGLLQVLRKYVNELEVRQEAGG